MAALLLPPRRRALVFGAALVLDVPLAELADAFDEVVLIDLMFLPATRRAAKRLGNVTLCVHDVSESLTGIEAGRPRVAAPARFHDDPAVDLVVSANLLSQLPIVPNAYLAREFAWDEAACAALGRELVAAHLAYLGGFRCSGGFDQRCGTSDRGSRRPRNRAVFRAFRHAVGVAGRGMAVAGRAVWRDRPKPPRHGTVCGLSAPPRLG